MLVVADGLTKLQVTEAAVQVAQRHRQTRERPCQLNGLPDGEEEEETGWVLARM